MGHLFPLALVGLTSAVGFLMGKRIFGLSGRDMGPALAGMLECVGLAAVFFAVNLGVGMLLILAFRTLTPGFAPLYLANDVSLLGFSLLQAVAFRWWLKAGSVSTHYR